MKVFNLFISGSFTADAVVGLAIAAFAIGFLVKSAVIIKQRKRILRLEDEMLANHARILSLEKRVSESKKSTSPPTSEYDLLPVGSRSAVN